MIKTELFTVRNILVIAVFAIVWQVIFARANAFLHVRDAAPAPA